MEICPLPEEFEAFLGCSLDSSCQLAIPNLGSLDPHTFQYQMGQMFDLSPQSSACLILGSEIELELFLASLSRVNTEETH